MASFAWTGQMVSVLFLGRQPVFAWPLSWPESGWMRMLARENPGGGICFSDTVDSSG